ncbi:MAG: amidohydrolase family protein [Woeseiaceae bacterium]|nr:amidohydrolase family protein [Woeseiaceae bacterium]
MAADRRRERIHGRLDWAPTPAAFLEPFTDAPDDSGFLINDPDDMREWIGGADGAGLQVMVHAIGDRANRELLDIYLDVADQNGARDRRFRIEHAQHIHPQDVPRFAAQDVIASMQPYHAIDDGRWADKVIGTERAQTTYAFHSLLESRAHAWRSAVTGSSHRPHRSTAFTRR